MKVGQLLSMETGELLPPELSEILARLREQADFMPPKQLKTVLIREWGSDFQSHFSRFDVRPMAAASIGQVHRACTRDGRDLAVKVQYPGIRRSIDSDVENVATLVKMTGLLPPGLELGPLLDEAKRQLHEEANYQREAACLARFGQYLDGDPHFAVPKGVAALTTENILSMTFAPGDPVETLAEAEQETRDDVAGRLIDLVLRELFEFGDMQTDPNFANYRYNPATGQIVLLDFGATRPVPPKVAEGYRTMLRAGLAGDRTGIDRASRLLGLFDETTAPHHIAAMVGLTDIVCAEFRKPGTYDFARTTLPETMRNAGMDLAMDDSFHHIPPMDTLFVQRKLAGVFMLACMLKARVNLQEILHHRLG